MTGAAAAWPWTARLPREGSAGVDAVAARLGDRLAGRAVGVTGGAGFIGSHLVRALLDVGAGFGLEVRVLDDLSGGLASNLDGLARTTLVAGSILDEACLRAWADGLGVIFHLAAVASVPRSVREPTLYVRTNADGTVAVLEAARAAGVSRLVNASSSSVYGDQPGFPRLESMALDPRSPYAAAKAAGEHAVSAWARSYEIDAASLRYFNIFGARQRPDSAYAAVIPRFCTAMLEGRPITVYGDGAQTRDFTFVANAVWANLLAAAAPEPLAGRVFNVATGERRTVIDLAHGIADRLGRPLEIEHADLRPGEVQHSLASTEQALRAFGYRPVVDFDEALDATCAWYAGEPEASGTS